VLEDHADLPVTQVAQLVVVHGENVLAVDDQLATRRFDETVDHSDDSRLPRPRQAHDDEELTPLHGEVDVVGSEETSGVTDR
jgi:hypothetical protein